MAYVTANHGILAIGCKVCEKKYGTFETIPKRPACIKTWGPKGKRESGMSYFPQSIRNIIARDEIAEPRSRTHQKLCRAELAQIFMNELSACDVRRQAV